MRKIYRKIYTKTLHIYFFWVFLAMSFHKLLVEDENLKFSLKKFSLFFIFSLLIKISLFLYLYFTKNKDIFISLSLFFKNKDLLYLYFINIKFFFIFIL